MKLPDLPYNFYNSVILTAKLGPRREVTLTFKMWPMLSDGRLAHSGQIGIQYIVQIRFGGIYNYPAIQGFFKDWETKTDWNSLHYLKYATHKKSTSNHLYFEVEFDGHPEHVLIYCQNITITEIEDGFQRTSAY